MLLRLLGSQKIFHSKKLPLPDNRQHALMRVRAGEPSELVARLQRYANTSCSAELDQPFKPLIATFARNTDMIELPRTRTDGLLDRMETVKNFHSPSLPLPLEKVGRI